MNESQSPLEGITKKSEIKIDFELPKNKSLKDILESEGYPTNNDEVNDYLEKVKNHFKRI